MIQRWTHGDTCGEEYNCEPKKDSEGELVLYADVERLTRNGETLQRNLDKAREELESTRLQLAACGVAASGNTPEAVKTRVGRDNPCWSASYGDVCAAVDREMLLRGQLAEAREALRSIACDGGQSGGCLAERAEAALGEGEGEGKGG